MNQYKTAPAATAQTLNAIPRSPISTPRMLLEQIAYELFELPYKLQ
jgi:hypothetical protein